MRIRHFVGFVLAFSLSAGLVILATQPVQSTKLLIGDAEFSVAELSAIGKLVGTVGIVEPDGFLVISVAGNFESASKRLAALGVDFVLKGEARSVNPHSLSSVKNHVAYQKAKSELSGMEEKDGGFYEALAFYLERRVESDGQLDPERWLRGARFRANMAKWNPGGKRNFGPNGAWTNIGPYNMDAPYRTYFGVPPLSGRKSGLAYAPSNTNIIYAAGAGGGIFKSTDAGVTWTPKSDGWPFLQSNCVAVDPNDPNIVYAGTGDYFNGGFPFGLMKSTNGGNTWTNHGAATFGGGIITRILIDPANANTLICTVANANRGIYRSTDAGVTWTWVLDIGRSFQDLDVSADDGSGRTWWAVGGPNFLGGKIYKSSDGIAWNEVTSPSAANETALEIGCSKLTRNTVYLLATGAEQIYKTTDAGTTWLSVKNNFPSLGANYNWSQKSYDYFIGCGAANGQDVVYVGLITVAASANGGTTWADIGLTSTNQAKTHNDQHFFISHPTDLTKSLIGSDGGIFACTHDQVTNTATFTPLNAGICDEMNYDIAVHPTDMSRIMGGQQDNATAASRGNLASWDNLYAGDGCWCDFDKNNPGIHYTTSQGGGIYRYDSNDDPSPTGISPNWSAAFVTPLIVAGNGSELFTATTSNFQKYVSGTTWTQSAQNIGSTVTCLAAAPSNGSIIYTGASSGQVWRTPDEGITFTRIDTNLADAGVGAIAVTRSDPNNVLVAVGNSNGIYRCTDVTQVSPVWTHIGVGLPAVSINAIEMDPHFPNTIYVGTDVGCFYTTNAGTSWVNMTTAGLPNVDVRDLEINAAGTAMYAGTYGRGIWKVAIDQPTYAVSGRITQSAAGVSSVVVNFKQGAVTIATATTDGNGDYSANVAPGTYTLQPTHNDKLFFPSTKDVTLPPDAINQNFTAGNIGPVSLTFQYPVVYSDQSRQVTVGLNTTTPVNRIVNLSDNSLKLNTPLTMTVPAGQQNAIFFVYGVTVVADATVTVTATAQGLTVPNTIIVRAKPVLNAFNLALSTVKGGRGVTGSVTIDKPSVGQMALYLSSDNLPVSTISPTNTSYTNGVSSKSVYCRTFAVGSTQLVTFTATFYGSTITKQLTVTP